MLHPARRCGSLRTWLARCPPRLPCAPGSCTQIWLSLENQETPSRLTVPRACEMRVPGLCVVARGTEAGHGAGARGTRLEGSALAPSSAHRAMNGDMTGMSQAKLAQAGWGWLGADCSVYVSVGGASWLVWPGIASSTGCTQCGAVWLLFQSPPCVSGRC